ncbi:MAG: NAD(P)/FAD-dependent oxidoreductase [Candidatus Omnitrophota bacterium]|nr:MAG: NAD(P)/FAD-dependent oxidoreductase [Candidatus Omnitrophota bacterium]
MIKFDIIVIGGGPAGSYAALAAAKRGLRVALFEEHGAIGWPRHDPGWLLKSDFTDSIVGAIGKVVFSTPVREYRVCDAESGELIEKSTIGGYLIRRDLLEKEIVALAIQAGANVYLKTKVLKLVRGEGKVDAIETNSNTIPRAEGKVFICADGIRSSNIGFAVSEGLCEPGELRPGISYILANADVTDGVIEHFLSSDSVLNYLCFFTHRKGLCYFSLPASTPLYEFQGRRDNIVSRKAQKAYPLEMCGYTRAISGQYGRYFKNMVKENVIFVGDASGGAGNIHGMIQGQFAGKVAASAVKENDITEERLAEYQELVDNTLGKAPFYWFSAIEDFGSFGKWFDGFNKVTEGIRATELPGL